MFLLINNKNCAGKFDYLSTKLLQDYKINQMNEKKKPFSSLDKTTHKVERRKSGLLEDNLETIYINKYIKTHQNTYLV